MSGVLENWAVGLAERLIDWGVGRLSAPRATPGQRAEQIDKMLETLESEPAAEPSGAADAPPASPGAGEATPVDPGAGQEIATACVPCALGHFSRSAGALEEAMRFKDQGITSNEILDRVGGVLKEQNTLERYDLTPEKLQRSPPWEREIAEEALDESRRLRHVLEGLESIEQLEGAAADAATFYRKLNREWFKRRFAHLGDRADVLADNISEEPT